MSSSYASLAVVTSVRWLPEDLAAAGTIDVSGTLGLDAPVLDGTRAIWCPGAYALRLLQSGAHHPFLAPGPEWIGIVPPKFLGRQVWAGRLADMPAFDRPRFVKLAEHKHSGIPAAIHTSSGRFAEAAAAVLGTGIESLSVVVSEPLAFRREFRTFITEGKVTAASFYLSTVPGVSGAPVTLTWDAFTDAGTAPNTDVATRFAQQVVDAMGDSQPPGYTLDVGQLGDGSWAVVEANAAWSSNIYHADPAGAIESILAAQAPGHPNWEWRPDSFFAAKARALPQL